MKTEEIVALAKAGFTAQEIAKLGNAELTETKQPETKPEVKPEAKPEIKPEAKPEIKPEVKPEAKPAENSNNDVLQAIQERMKELTDTMHASALANSNQPAQESVDDILARIINPPAYTDKK